ncbi:MAG: hypothetical protein WC536_01455 [Patescibacteria group bacterium]
MKRVMPIKTEFKLLENDETKSRVQLAYNRIFTIANQNLMKQEMAKRQAKKKGGIDSNVQ